MAWIVFSTGTFGGGWFDLHRLGRAKQLLQPSRNLHSFLNDGFLLLPAMTVRADGIEQFVQEQRGTHIGHLTFVQHILLPADIPVCDKDHRRPRIFAVTFRRI